MSVLSLGERPLIPSKDKHKTFAVMGGFGGMMFGLALVVFIGLLDRRWQSIADARASFRRPERMLGILPNLPDDLSDPEQAATAAHYVHHIRALLQISHDSLGNQAFAVTSPSPGSGKTSLALALGLSFAASGSKTLLVDCDVIGGGLTARMETIIRRKLGQILRREGFVTDEQLAQALEIARQTNRRVGAVLVESGLVSEADIAHALSVQSDSLVGAAGRIGGRTPAGMRHQAPAFRACLFFPWERPTSSMSGSSRRSPSGGSFRKRAKPLTPSSSTPAPSPPASKPPWWPPKWTRSSWSFPVASSAPPPRRPSSTWPPSAPAPPVLSSIAPKPKTSSPPATVRPSAPVRCPRNCWSPPARGNAGRAVRLDPIANAVDSLTASANNNGKPKP